MSSLVLRQYQIKDSPFGEIPFAHNYLVRYDDNGNVVSEMHGLAYDPVEDQYKAVGRSSDYIRSREFGEKSYLNLPGQHEKVLIDRPGDDLSTEWQTLRDTADKIDGKGLTYIWAGSDMNGPRDWDAPTPDVISGNSNSFNRTLLDALRIPVPGMPFWAPGKENPLLREKELFPPQPQGGLLSPVQPKAGLLSPALPKAGLLNPSQPNEGSPMRPRERVLGPIY
jgi:hypothetical protein